MRTNQLRRAVRQVYRTAVCERCGDEYQVSILLPYGKSVMLAYGYDRRTAWQRAWDLAIRQYPLVRMGEDREP